MKDIMALSILLAGLAAATSAAQAQQPAVAEPQGRTPSATEEPMRSPPAEGKALVYVYRPSARALSMSRAQGYVLVFVNGDFLAELANSSFASATVPKGTMALAAANATQLPLGQYFPIALRWPKCEGNSRKANCTWDPSVQSREKEDHGCAKVDWQRVTQAASEDVKICKSELAMTSAALDNWLDPGRKRRAEILGLLLPGELGDVQLANAAGMPGGDLRAWLQTCGPNPFPNPSRGEADRIRRDRRDGNFSDDWSRCKNEAAEAYLMLSSKELLRIQVQAGKTYYVKWSFPYKVWPPTKQTGEAGRQKMELVDAAAGAKEISGLPLAAGATARMSASGAP